MDDAAGSAVRVARIALLAACLGACLGACSETPRTQVMLIVDGECGVVARADSVRVTVTVDGEPVAPPLTYSVGGIGDGWPRRIALVPRDGDASRRYEARVEALDGATTIASAAVRSGYVAESTRVLRVVLEDSCLDVAACGANEACRAGGCAAIEERSASSLPEGTSASALCTMPLPDAGPLDAATPPDAGPRDGGTLDAGPGDGGPDAGPRPRPLQVSLGAGHSCARFDDGTVWCWGQNAFGQLGGNSGVAERDIPLQVHELDDAEHISAGGSHTCAIRSDATLWCWGAGVNGQLGDGSVTNMNRPVAVSSLAGVTGVGTGGVHSCALSDSGLTCWGGNLYGQVGDGTMMRRDVPVGVAGLGITAAGIALGNFHTCARSAAGDVWCWGVNGEGQLGHGDRSVSSPPEQVAMLPAVTEIAPGSQHTCARTAAGTVWCVGHNRAGQIGNGMSSFMDVLAPEMVVGLTDATAIAADIDATCAIRATGGAVCWGDNTDGRLGADSGDAFHDSPTPVVTLTEVSSIDLGGGHGCAVAGDEVWCWGRNDHGQLGNGTTGTARPSPVRVMFP